jgi:hypothetical protein
VKVERRNSVLKHFDFNLLGDPDFQEDSVREEIIVPILKGLGYGPTKPHKIIRSKKLLHPFVSIGSATKNIYLVPDYLLEVNDRFAWILEAKAPKENILHTKHVEQAYSYAIHSEIRVPYFALCNGKEFVLYHISKPRPVLHFDMLMLPSYWDNLTKLLGPRDVLNCDLRMGKDLGLHLKRLGFHEVSNLIFPDVPIAFIGHIGQDQFTFGSGLKVDGGDSYVVSYDFNSEVMQQLRGKIPEKAFKILMQPLGNESRVVSFSDAVYRVTIDCRVGDKLEENEDEIFLPLQINQILE